MEAFLKSESYFSPSQSSLDITQQILEIHNSYQSFIHEHKAQIRLLKGEFRTLTRAFDAYLGNVIDNCVRNFNVLSNIISELKIAEASGIFDLIVLSEIHGNCEKLLTARMDDKHFNEGLESDIYNLQNNIQQEKLAMKKSSFTKSVKFARYITESSETLMEFSAQTGNFVVTGVATGLAIVGAILRFINYCKSFGFTQLVKDLKQLETKIALLTGSVKSLEETAGKRIQYQLENYLESTQKGIKYYSFDGVRTKEQASKMITESKDLQNSYIAIRHQAHRTHLYLQKFI